MPDVYSDPALLGPDATEQLIAALELRAADPRQTEMRAGYLHDLALPPGARVVEVGCGTGAVSRALAGMPGIAEVVGVDPVPRFLAKARELAVGVANLSFQQADGRALPFGDGQFDAVVLHTMISHVPGPEAVLAEAHRVLRGGGRIAVFEGDYNTMSVATAAIDPLQACAQAMAHYFVHDPWIVRRLPSLLAGAGFAEVRLRSHGYAQTTDPSYLLSIVDRGADGLAGDGRIGPELADALKGEARRRATTGTFFGHIAYASLTATRPG